MTHGLRLHREVVVFMLTCSQHSLIHDPHLENDILSVLGSQLLKISKSNHFGIMLFFTTSDFTLQKWATEVNRFSVFTKQAFTGDFRLN